MKLKAKELLEYFDTKDSSEYGDTTALISVVGEDLGTALFQHYRESIRGSKIVVVDSNEEIPTEGKRIGRRLDRWILEEKKGERVLYQTEIKNWCSRAIGGITVPVKIKKAELIKCIQKNWGRDVALLNEKSVNGLNKVLVEMPTDKKIVRLGISGPYEKRPLLIFWDARNPSGNTNWFSRYDVKTKHHHFDYCYVFSCSLYLRHLLNKGFLDLHMEIPNAERRLSQMVKLFKI